MKKIISAIIAASMLCSAMPAFAYEQADYHAKADELKTLIAECQELGINTQYEEIDANIIEVYADRIAEFQANGLSSTITNTQLGELDSLYSNAKANLNAYINGTKEAPNKAYTYGTGDNIRISGASLKNRKGDPYFSAGVGHFGLANYIEELNGYRFENVQTVVGLGDIVTKDRKVDSWDAGVQGGADVTFEMVTNNGASNNTSLHIVNKTEKADNVYGTIYQRVPVKPNTEYEFSFKVLGTNDARSSLFSWDDWDNREYFGYNGGNWTTWTKVTRTFTTGSNEYYKGVRFLFEGKCDVYLDDITVKPTGSTKNRILNGGFDGDGTEDFDIFYNDQTNLLSTIKTLDAAEKNNVRVEVLLQLQQEMPTVITDKYPEIGTGRYNIDHEVAQKVEKAYIEGVLAAISDYDSLGSIIVANEPAYNSSNYSYGTKFASYLEKKYGTIGALQTAYGTTKYSSFANVGMPDAFESSARFYDWKNFNEEIFSNWYAKTVQIIKNCIPGIPVSIKAQPDVAVNDSSTKKNEHLVRGLDMERLGQLSDYNGNDSYSYSNSNETNSVRSTMMWYDYLGSTSGKPIYDSEKHVTEDATMSNYDDTRNKFTKQAVWESMIHGLDMYSLWTWEIDVKDTSSSRYGHLALRPEALSGIAKAGLDANR
ncbi:MAG: beta-galactosidase, partial [Clostridia bacterium]|nr:beta-galactosidase [Clostridia bacterium]